MDYDSILARRILHLMTPAEVAALDPAVVDVQMHTHRHHAPAVHSLFQRELLENAQAIRGMRGKEAVLEHFCYPSGSHSTQLKDWLQEEGVVSATTSEPEIATRATDPLLLPRFVDTMTVSERVFRTWLSGAAVFFPQRPGARRWRPSSQCP